jgi:hypothetical protein
MYYRHPYILRESVWNNALYSHDTHHNTLTIPAIQSGNISEITLWKNIVFITEENHQKLSHTWLDHFIRTKYYTTPCIVFDNHNHALYFWYESLIQWRVNQWVELIHIDQHSDLWKNENSVPIGVYNKEEYLENIWKFTNFSCNVWNYIVPALEEWLISKITRIESEYDLDQYREYTADANSILNLDLDFFAPDLDYINYEKKKTCILRFARQVKLITIATSPWFMDQEKAIEVLRDIFSEEKILSITWINYY